MNCSRYVVQYLPFPVRFNAVFFLLEEHAFQFLSRYCISELLKGALELFSPQHGFYIATDQLEIP